MLLQLFDGLGGSEREKTRISPLTFQFNPIIGALKYIMTAVCIPLCVGCSTANHNNSRLVSVKIVWHHILPGLRHPRGPAWARHSCIHHWHWHWHLALFWWEIDNTDKTFCFGFDQQLGSIGNMAPIKMEWPYHGENVKTKSKVTKKALHTKKPNWDWVASFKPKKRLPWWSTSYHR